MFHASHHIQPVPASEDEVHYLISMIFRYLFNPSFSSLQYTLTAFLLAQIEAEANAVEAVVKGLCPLRIVLDRVVLTSTGVLLGCWQVISTFYNLLD